jgi:hypothetical protein
MSYRIAAVLFISKLAGQTFPFLLLFIVINVPKCAEIAPCCTNESFPLFIKFDLERKSREKENKCVCSSSCTLTNNISIIYIGSSSWVGIKRSYFLEEKVTFLTFDFLSCHLGQLDSKGRFTYFSCGSLHFHRRRAVPGHRCATRRVLGSTNQIRPTSRWLLIIHK